MQRLTSYGFTGVYFPGTQSPHKAIIATGGGFCDEKASIAMSGYLRDAGYNVLVLGFYKWKGMSKDLVSIPVDYVECAVSWLKSQGITRIAMTSLSTGAGYTLLSASLIPDINVVIPIVPYDYVMEGTTDSFKRLGRSVYTWHGVDVPYSPWTLLDCGFFQLLRRAAKNRKYGIARLFRYAYDHNPVTEESRIRVENMHADVLFLAVKDDDAWPSDVAVPRMVERLKEAGYAYTVEYHIYEKGSHALSDGLDELSGFTKFALKHLIPAEKRYPQECEEARQDSFKRVLDFLERKL